MEGRRTRAGGVIVEWGNRQAWRGGWEKMLPIAMICNADLWGSLRLTDSNKMQTSMKVIPRQVDQFNLEPDY